MILRDWLKKEGVKPYVFAKSIGMASPNLYRCLSGGQRASAKYALIIESITNGQVSRCEALFPEDYLEKDEHGGEQYRATPKIHFNLVTDMVVEGKEHEKPINEADFNLWAFGQETTPSILACCVLWANKHTNLKKIDHMKAEEGSEFMYSEYRKYQKRRAKEKKLLNKS